MHQDSIVNLLVNPLKLTSNVNFTRVEGGGVNQTFKLVDNDRSFAVKWIADDGFSGINRFHQFVLQEQLAHRKIAPMPVWLSDDGKLWVESWLEPARPTTNSDEQINILANVLSVIHSQPITARPLNLPQRLKHYIKVANLPATDPLVHQTNEVSEYLHLETDAAALTLCHNDLALVHILEPTVPVIVDWEYAAMGNRYFDIASAVVVNRLSEDAAAQLCGIYAAHANLREEHVRSSVCKQIDIVKLTNTLWQKALDFTSSELDEPPVVL